MFGRKRSSSDTLFRLQQDGRYGMITGDSSDSDLEHFLSLPSHQDARQNRGPVPLSTSINHRRIRLGWGLMIVVVAVFFGRSAHVQIVQGQHYSTLSSENKERTDLLLPARGRIYDSTGIPLAWNEPAFVLTMTLADLPEEEQRHALFGRVANLIGVQPTDLDLLLSQYSTHPFDPIPIVDNLPYESAIRLAIEVSDLPGFSLTTRTKRIYDSSAPSLSHVLGYTGALSEADFEAHKGEGYRPIDSIGKTGLERTYEELLRGVPGRLVYEVDALGEKLSILSKEDSVLGSNVTLSLNVEFQKFIETQMQATFERVGASRGSVVALDPQTGAVRALVSLPSYDANEFTDGISQDRYTRLVENEDQPLFFRAISGEFPSGSTLKPVIAYAALAEGIVGEHTSFVSTGGLRIGQWFFPDWKAGGHGVTDVRKALAQSVNTYFYIVGGGFDAVTGLGVERITDYAGRFGFGSTTGIDLPNEADGFLPSKEWKQDVKGERWYVGDTYHLAIGQGDFLTTPLQMAVATAVVANGGSKITPYMVEQADGFGADLLAHVPPVRIKDLDAFAMSLVRQGMRQTVTEGSARSMSTLSEAVAGKTGTAQTPGDEPYHSWFTGFGPYENPTITLVVLIEEGGESNDAAVPLARQILDWWFTYGD
ncbi:penicillin-binding protein 2 [Patescibacteria group bacterium]|nr:MAG: penicillin-binding protein 2 [Patescibacteria group bacterium]